MLTSAQIGATFSAVPQSGSKSPTVPQSTSSSFVAELAAIQSVKDKSSTAPGAVAQSETAESDKAESIKSEFREWKAEYLQKGIGQDRRQQVQQFSAGFEQLIDKAVAQRAYDNPQAFLRSLSPSELEVLQHIHCLADSLAPSGLSKEGALNLLLAPGHSQDIDNDGFQMIGLGKTWQFPPVNAPESVKQAWKETTAQLSESDVMLLEGSLLPMSIGNNAYISPDANYKTIVQRVIEGAEIGKKFDKPWQYETREREIELLKTFLGKL